MRNIAKILVIVLVAVLVAGGTWLIGYRMGASENTAFTEREPRGDFDGDGDRPFSGSEEFPERGGREGRSGDGLNLFGITGFAKTLIPITLIIAGVVLIQNIIGRFRRGKNQLPMTADSTDTPEPSSAISEAKM